jgi:transcription initiation factor IIE alpha subunit
MAGRLSKAARAALKAVTGKRARSVVKHILKHGSITTDDLKERYGYDHPPRAIKDVSDQGIPLL